MRKVHPLVFHAVLATTPRPACPLNAVFAGWLALIVVVALAAIALAA